MAISIPTRRSFAKALCVAVAPFAIVAGCSSAPSPSGENVSSSSSGYVVGNCECTESGSCSDESFSDKPSNDSYYITTFTGGGMACGGEATGDWAYIADEARFGCGAKVKITANGKSCVALVSDCGPNKCVEEAASGGSCGDNHPIIDASPFITQHLFGISSSGWSDHRSVTVEEVDSSSTVGCPGTSEGGTSGGGTGGGGGTMSSCTGGDEAVTRGTEWVDAKLHYCQSAYDAVDGDSSCWGWEGSSHRCDRESNSAWNAYRSDCSGFITFAWGLPPVGDGGYVTGDFAPYSDTFSEVIPAESLQPGDACNKTPDEHIVLFVKWITPGKEAEFMEEPGCSADPPYAHSFTSAVSTNGPTIYIDYEGADFTAIRYKGKGAACTAGTTNGDCYSHTLSKYVTTGTCVDSSSDGDVYQCENGNWILAKDIQGESCAGGVQHGGGSGSDGCHSDTLNREEPDNACVQSKFNSDWYQCDNGQWVDRWTDPDACDGVYPLNSKSANAGNGCYSDTDKKNMPDNACVQSSYDDDWYQCANGSWTDRWTDPSPCNGVYPLKVQPSGGGSSNGGGADDGSGAARDLDAMGYYGNNLVALGQFLVDHGYSRAGAAGVAGCVAGESLGNPEDSGTGGAGLIGWTPPSKLYDDGGTFGGNPATDLQNQFKAILNYNNANGPVGELNAESSPVSAADFYSQEFERPEYTDSDVRSVVANAVFSALGAPTR